MLSLFENKKQRPVQKNSREDRIASNIFTRCIRLQQNWAAFMQRKTERLSENGKLIVFLLFCFSASCLNIYLIASKLIGDPSVSISISRIKTPSYSMKTGDENTQSAATITKQEYQRIEYFRHCMDSLARSPSGKAIYDSILNQHAGIMDSVAFLEKIYQSQTK